MTRRIYLYAALSLPIVGFVAYAAFLSDSDRATFLNEFKHNAVSLFKGDSDEPIQGLRGGEANVTDGEAPHAGGAGDEEFNLDESFQERVVDKDDKPTENKTDDRLQEDIGRIDSDEDG